MSLVSMEIVLFSSVFLCSCYRICLFSCSQGNDRGWNQSRWHVF